MGAFAVVKRQPGTDPGLRLGDAFVGLQVNLFLLEGAPQALDEDLVHEPVLAVHADRLHVPQDHRLVLVLSVNHTGRLLQGYYRLEALHHNKGGRCDIDAKAGAGRIRLRQR